MTVAKQRHLRPGDYLADNDTVVVRGGDLDPAVMRSDAERYHSIYGAFGLLVFAARNVPVDELAQQAPLVRFDVLTLIRVGVLRAAGFRLAPTGRNPKHFTVMFDDLDAGIERLRSCEHRTWINPYHER
jgi:hypothetical protein